MKILKLRKKDVVPSSKLIYKTFKKYNGDDYFDEEAVFNILNYFDTKKNSEASLVKMFNRTPISYVAIEGDTILGVIRGNKNKVTSLMVDSKFHGKGTGKKLMAKFELEAIKKGSKFIKIRSSLVAVKFYESCGYKKTTGIRSFMGLKIYNMKKVF